MAVPASSWSAALNLAERQAAAGSPAAPPSPAARERAARRLARWRALPSFAAPAGGEDRFARRLASVGLSEADLLAHLASPLENPGVRPGWWDDLQRLFPEPPAAVSPPATGSSWQSAFAPFLTPFIQEARRGLTTALEPIAGRGRLDRGRVELQVLAELRARLLGIAARTLALEVNAAGLLGRLQGVIPADRFQSFAATLARPEVRLDLYREYPVLARILASYVSSWSASLRELAGRLDQDWDALAAALNGGRELGALNRLRLAGDRHRQGRAVMICSFATGVTLVYKPRPVGGEARLQQFLSWVNGQGFSVPFRPYMVMDREAYGWAELIPHQPCGSEAEVERFFFRQGGYLAVFYLLGATDVHGENIIASGEHPVVIDAEALLVGFPTRAEADAFSVRNTLMLPENHENPALRDLSGIGKGSGQIASGPLAVWVETGTDTMRLTRKQAPIVGFQNRPTLAGTEVDPTAYREAVLRGFTEGYRLLVRQREEILAPGGLLDGFAEDEIRVVPRPSSFYLAILEESFHPGALGDALDRERLFDRLWLELEEGRPYGSQVVEAERADLWYGDIPIFTSRPCDLDMRTSRGEPLPGFFQVTGMDAARERIRRLSEEDLERQLAEIRARL